MARDNRHPFFPAPPQLDPYDQVTPPRPVRRAAIQNVKLRVAAATSLAKEVVEQAKRGNVRVEDFAPFEDELGPPRKKR